MKDLNLASYRIIAHNADSQFISIDRLKVRQSAQKILQQQIASRHSMAGVTTLMLFFESILLNLSRGIRELETTSQTRKKNTMNLVVDYGNSLAKVGIFRQHNLVDQYAFSNADELKNFIQNFSAKSFILSSVADHQIPVMDWVTHIQRKYILTPSLPLPVNNLYATPHTLGVDRIAGICGAQQRFPASNSLVIDAGTCVTYDFLDYKGNYHGGSIAPGLRMRLKAMHVFTARLPLVDVVDDPPLLGNTTEACLQSGAINGMVEEINGIIRQYQLQFEGLQVILCGGDGRFFENKLKAPIFAIPELVLSGLNSILIYNVGG